MHLNLHVTVSQLGLAFSTLWLAAGCGAGGGGGVTSDTDAAGSGCVLATCQANCPGGGVAACESDQCLCRFDAGTDDAGQVHDAAHPAPDAAGIPVDGAVPPPPDVGVGPPADARQSNPDGTKPDAAVGQCTPDTAAALCAEGEGCVRGACAPCAHSADCGGGRICDAGVCRACAATAECPDGSLCNDGVCGGCADDAACHTAYGDAAFCDQGRCGPRTCLTDVECRDLGWNCTDNTCLPCADTYHCIDSEAYGAGFQCLAGQCSAGACAQDADCPAAAPLCGDDHVCRGCVPTADGPDAECIARYGDGFRCTPAGACLLGACLAPGDCGAVNRGLCILDDGAPNPYACVPCQDGVDDEACRAEYGGQDSIVCLSGRCVEGCVGLSCDGGQICDRARCRPCAIDAECATAFAGYVCLEGSCQAADCNVGTPCPGGRLCVNNQCIECTAADTHICDARGQFCDVNTGSCQTCRNNNDCGADRPICAPTHDCRGCAPTADGRDTECLDRFGAGWMCSAGGACVQGDCLNPGECLDANRGLCTLDASIPGVAPFACRPCVDGTDDTTCRTEYGLDGLICDGGRCVPGCDGPACAGGQLCQNRRCIDCTQDVQCATAYADGFLCIDNQCQQADCGPNTPCPGGRVCDGGACVECTVADTSLCDAQGKVCDSNLKVCLECLDGGDCAGGAGICEAGSCRPCVRGECGFGYVCAAGTCTPGFCFIGGGIWARNALAPNGCAMCDPDHDAFAWTPIPFGACDDSQTSTYNDTCTLDGLCQGTQYICPSLPCAAGVPHGTGPNDCTLERAHGFAGCFIDGACVNPSQVDPNNPCMACDGANNAWAPVLEGTHCGTCQVCSADHACVPVPANQDPNHECIIGDVPCLSCDGSGACGASDPGVHDVRCQIDPNNFCGKTGMCGLSGSCDNQAQGAGVGVVSDSNECTTNDLCDGSGHPTGTPLPDGTHCGVNSVCNGGHCGPCTQGPTARGNCQVGQVCTAGGQCVAGDCLGDADCDLTGVPACKVRLCQNHVCADLPTDAADGDPCSDNLSCTSGDTCLSGVCTPSHLDVGGCTYRGRFGGGAVCVAEGAIAPGTECLECFNDIRLGYNTAPVNGDCNDGMNCTTDTCNLVGSCTHTPVNAACPDPGPCGDPLCGGRGCSATWYADGAACDDANASTLASVCTTDAQGGHPCIPRWLADTCVVGGVNRTCVTDRQTNIMWYGGTSVTCPGVTVNQVTATTNCANLVVGIGRGVYSNFRLPTPAEAAALFAGIAGTGGVSCNGGRIPTRMDATFGSLNSALNFWTSTCNRGSCSTFNANGGSGSDLAVNVQSTFCVQQL